jgi:type IV pilus assembly protein PilC
MSSYKYTAFDPVTQNNTTAEIEAENEDGVIKVITKQGLVPVEIKLAGSSNSFIGGVGQKVPTKEKILFIRQLATLINAGLPLIQAIRSALDQTQNKALKNVIKKMISDVEGGAQLSVAMAHHPKVFNQINIALVAAGETSGTLDKALDRMALQQEKDASIMGKIKGALAYPVVILCVMGGVLTFMMVKVLPTVAGIYKSLPGASLPLVTRILMDLSQFMIHKWYIIIIIVIVVVVVFREWKKTKSGRATVDRLKMVMWPTGPLLMKLYMARFARTSSTLAASGVPLLEVLDISGTAVNNVHIKKSLQIASEKVRSGGSLAEALQKDKNFLPLVPSMIKIGEESGTLEQMLERLAIYYEGEVDNQINTISSLMEPVMMVVLGVVAFTIVAAVLLPIYSLANNSAFTSSTSY